MRQRVREEMHAADPERLDLAVSSLTPVDAGAHTPSGLLHPPSTLMLPTTSFLRTALIAVLALGFSAGLTACDSGSNEPDPPPPGTTGIITGRFALPAGASGSLENARVAIYTSQAEFDQDNPLTVAAASSNGSYTVSNVNPGNYYLDVWKDNNNNSRIDGGDFYGAYTTNGTNASAFAVVANQTTTIDGSVRPVPNGRPAIAGAPKPAVAK